MTNALARVDVDRLPGGPITVTVSGEIDLSNATYLARRLDDAAELADDLVVDLSALSYMDSQGLRVLHRLVGEHRASHVRMRIVAAPGSIAGVLLSVSGIATVVEVVAPGAVPAPAGGPEPAGGRGPEVSGGPGEVRPSSGR